MMITVEARSRCLICGCFLSSYAFPDVRINKLSLRQLPGHYILVYAPRCPECGLSTWGLRNPVPAPLARETYVASSWRITTESWREIEAYRERRWPG